MQLHTPNVSDHSIPADNTIAAMYSVILCTLDPLAKDVTVAVYDIRRAAYIAYDMRNYLLHQKPWTCQGNHGSLTQGLGYFLSCATRTEIYILRRNLDVIMQFFLWCLGILQYPVIGQNAFSSMPVNSVYNNSLTLHFYYRTHTGKHVFYMLYRRKLCTFTCTHATNVRLYT